MRKHVARARHLLNTHPVPRHTAVVVSTIVLATTIPLMLIAALESLHAMKKPVNQLATQQIPKVKGACQYKKMCNGQNCDSYVLSCSTSTTDNNEPDLTNKPVGFLETIDCKHATGWAYNSQIPSKYISVLLYEDGEIGTGKYLTSIPANLRLDSNDVIEELGNHEFYAAIPASLKDGNLHQIYAYAYDASASAQPSLLLGSPKAIACAQTTLPIKTPLNSPNTFLAPTTSINPNQVK